MSTSADSTSLLQSSLPGTLGGFQPASTDVAYNALGNPSNSRLSTIMTTLKPSTSPSITYSGAYLKDNRVRISMMQNSPNLFYKDPLNLLMSVLQKTTGVLFPFQPIITMTHVANYENQAPIHSNFSFHSYKNSEISGMNITCEFPARTNFEAQYVLAAIHFLRSLTLMFTGNDNASYAGLPPLVCTLSGMGFGGLDNLPIAVTKVTVTYPDNVDYITVRVPGMGDELTKVPVQCTVSVDVLPMFSRSTASQFNTQQYSTGSLRLMGHSLDIPASSMTTPLDTTATMLPLLDTQPILSGLPQPTFSAPPQMFKVPHNNSGLPSTVPTVGNSGMPI